MSNTLEVRYDESLQGILAYTPSPKSYLDDIFRISDAYLERHLSRSEYAQLKKDSHCLRGQERTQIVKGFSDLYKGLIRKRVLDSYDYNKEFTKQLFTPSGKVKVVWGDCLSVLEQLPSESVHLMVTSPPYYNARAYSQWRNLDKYLADMKRVIEECYRVIGNHRTFVFNIGDITGNDNLHTRSSWGARRIPLGAYFMNIFEDVGFRFVDDYIWDKGQVQSQRHKNGDTPHPMYQYPVNCYEHIMVFQKHRKDDVPYPCPVCGCLKVNGNAYSGVGIKSWECKNTECFERSPANRGKRFSFRSMMMEELKTNQVDADRVYRWRRDIVRLTPTIKVNSKGQNTLGHTAPFPPEIPAFATDFFSGREEIVLDPFAGSFTSAIEAQKAGRIGVGIELDRSLQNSVHNRIHKCNLLLEQFICQLVRS